MDIQIIYSSGALTNLEVSGTISTQIDVAKNGEEEETETAEVLTTGGTLEKFQTRENENNIIYITWDGACLGPECENVDGGDTGDSVTVEEAEMTGTLESIDETTGNITITTFDETLDTGSSAEPLTSQNTLTDNLAMPIYKNSEIINL